MATISDWLHDGERNAIGIYRRPWIAFISWSLALALSPTMFIIRSLPERMLATCLVALLAGFGVMSWKRKVAILTPTAILFRPLFGKPLELNLRGLKRVSRTEQLAGEAGWIEVCRLEFLVGGFFDVPWGYSGDLAGDLERLIVSPPLG